MPASGARSAQRHFGLLAVAALALAGCLGGDRPAGEPAPSPAPSDPPQPGEDCDAAGPFLPVLPPWAAHGGVWAGFVQPSLGSPQGWRGAGDGGEAGLALLVDHATGPFSAVRVEADVLLVRGTHPEGAGVVFHWDAESYNIARFSPSEGGWHLFTVVAGERTKLDAAPVAGAPAAPGFCEWVRVAVEAAGRDVTLQQDGRTVLAARLPQDASAAGHAGLFVRGDAVALFAGYAATGS